MQLYFPSRTVVSFSLLLLMTLAVPARAAWLDAAWSHRVELTAKPEQIENGGPFSDITLLLMLDSDHLGGVFDVARTDGADLVITGSDGVTTLGHEIVSYDGVARTAEIWFKAPTLSTTQNVFYLYYGNHGAEIVPVPGAAWTEAHIGVFHFEDDPSLGILADSSPHGNFGTTGLNSGFTSADVIDGQIGQGWLLNGQTHWIDGDNISSPDSSFTISAWFALSNLNQDANFAFSVEEGFWHLSAKRNGQQKHADFAAGNNSFRWNPEIRDNDLHNFVWTLDGVNDTIFFYYDGVRQGGFGWVPDPNKPLYTGLRIQGNVGIAGPLWGFNNPYDLMEGTVDEFRVIEGVLSGDRIATEYRNQKDPSGFYTFEVQTNQVVAVDPMRALLGRVSVWPNPFRGTADITIDAAAGELEVVVYDVAGRLVRRLMAPSHVEEGVRLQWDGRDEAGKRASNGLYFVRAVSPAGVLGSAKVLYQR